MDGAVVVAAVAAAGAAWFLVGGPGPDPSLDLRARIEALGVARGPVSASGAAPPDPLAPSTGLPGRTSWLACATAGLAAWALIGGVVGVGIGVAVAVAAPPLLARLETGSARRRRLALIRTAPLVADLLAAALSAGVPLEQAVPVIAHSVGGPAQEVLSHVHARVRLGESSALAWSRVAGTPGLGPIARSVARSARTGAPLAALLSAAAEDLRNESQAAALAQVRAVAVRAVLPLGLCLLPAFVLLGIVPVVAGLVPGL